MRTNSSTLQEAAILRRAATALAARARAERGGELTLTQVAVLGRIAVEGPITPREVAAELRMVPQSLTRPLAALESAGLVRRTPDPEDGRGALLHVTAAGRAALRAEMAPRDRWLARAISATCTAHERRTLAAAADIVATVGAGVAPIEP
jgi:DNA-binding MarR family transcriptional regulator